MRTTSRRQGGEQVVGDTGDLCVPHPGDREESRSLGIRATYAYYTLETGRRAGRWGYGRPMRTTPRRQGGEQVVGDTGDLCVPHPGDREESRSLGIRATYAYHIQETGRRAGRWGYGRPMRTTPWRQGGKQVVGDTGDLCVLHPGDREESRSLGIRATYAYHIQETGRRAGSWGYGRPVCTTPWRQGGEQVVRDTGDLCVPHPGDREESRSLGIRATYAYHIQETGRRAGRWGYGRPMRTTSRRQGGEQVVGDTGDLCVPHPGDREESRSLGIRATYAYYIQETGRRAGRWDTGDLCVLYPGDREESRSLGIRATYAYYTLETGRRAGR